MNWLPIGDMQFVVKKLQLNHAVSANENIWSLRDETE